MPLLVRYPEKVKAGQVNNKLVSNLDFAQTLIDYAEIKAPADMQGKSLKPLLENKPVQWRDAIYYRYWMHGAHFNVPAHFGIRTKTDKLIFFYGHDLGTHTSLKYQDGPFKWPDPPRSDWKVEEPYWEYYDLSSDPREMGNGYEDEKNRLKISRLKSELERLRETYGDTDVQYPEMEEIMKKYWK